MKDIETDYSGVQELETAQCFHVNATRIIQLGNDFYIDLILFNPWSIFSEIEKAKAEQQESPSASIPGKALARINMNLRTFLNLKNQMEEIYTKLPEELKSGKLKDAE